MKKIALPALLLASTLLINGCASMIGATSDQPIHEDRTSRTTGSLIDDELIEIKSLVNIGKASQELKQSHVSVTSYNGVVLICGQVPNSQVKQLAGNVVGKLNKVRKVHNELQVAGPTSTIVRANDSWLTAKVKSKMLADRELKAMGIKVVTENGTVYLLGLVENQQANRAVEITRNTVGVQKVVKMFEYVD